MRKKLRILVLMHESLIPPQRPEDMDPEDFRQCKTEYDVVQGLQRLGHSVRNLGVRFELLPIREAVQEWKPDVVFNLLEEFKDTRLYNINVVAYLELIGVPFTGCPPSGLMICSDKGLSKKILTYHRIKVPQFFVVPKGKKARRPSRMSYPLIVKSLTEEASYGISKASIVHTDEALAERVRFVHDRIHTDAIAEAFIAGREIYASVLGNQRLQVLPIRELVFHEKPEGEPLIATAKAKWDPEYQEKWGIDHEDPKLDAKTEANLRRVSKRIYRRLQLAGYARIDFRLSKDGKLYFLEANPNPDIKAGEEFAWSAKEAGYTYEKMLEKIVRLALRRRPPAAR